MIHKLDAPIKHHEYFHLSSGRVLKNINELLNALKSMDHRTFEHHVNTHKNDFGNWIKHVYKDEWLASKVFETKDEHEMAKTIEARLFQEEKPKEDHNPEHTYADHKHAEHKPVQNKQDTLANESHKNVQKQAPAQVHHTSKVNHVPNKRDGPQHANPVKRSETKRSERHNGGEHHLPRITTNPQSKNYIHLDKIEEILVLEKEIEKREEKIQEIEERLEKELEHLNKQKDQNFFSREFIHGTLIGLLIALIVGVVYIRFFA
jgi:hypothetical protein